MCGLFGSKSSSKPRKDCWIFKLLQYRGILDVIIFTIVFIRKWNGVQEFSKENLFGDFCANDALEKNQIFCGKFIEMAIYIRLAAAICLTVGGYFVSAYSVTAQFSIATSESISLSLSLSVVVVVFRSRS